MATVQILKDLGEQMGLKGTELRDFIKGQQNPRTNSGNMIGYSTTSREQSKTSRENMRKA